MPNPFLIDDYRYGHHSEIFAVFLISRCNFFTGLIQGLNSLAVGGIALTAAAASFRFEYRLVDIPFNIRPPGVLL